MANGEFAIWSLAPAVHDQHYRRLRPPAARGPASTRRPGPEPRQIFTARRDRAACGSHVPARRPAPSHRGPGFSHPISGGWLGRARVSASAAVFQPLPLVRSPGPAPAGAFVASWAGLRQLGSRPGAPTVGGRGIGVHGLSEGLSVTRAPPGRPGASPPPVEESGRSRRARAPTPEPRADARVPSRRPRPRTDARGREMRRPPGPCTRPGPLSGPLSDVVRGSECAVFTAGPVRSGGVRARRNESGR
jgi:hypothetical protein